MPCQELSLTPEYVAGFFDGEGSIGIYPNGQKRYHLRTQVTQNTNAFSDKLFAALLGRYGGTLSVMTGQQGNLAYNWQLNGDKAAAFLTEIEPALKLKRQQAQLAIAWQEQRPPVFRNRRGRIVRTQPTVLAFDRKICGLMAALKRSSIETIMIRDAAIIEVVRSLRQRRLCLEEAMLPMADR